MKQFLENNVRCQNKYFNIDIPGWFSGLSAKNGGRWWWSHHRACWRPCKHPKEDSGSIIKKNCKKPVFLRISANYSYWTYLITFPSHKHLIVLVQDIRVPPGDSLLFQVLLAHDRDPVEPVLPDSPSPGNSHLRELVEEWERCEEVIKENTASLL